MEGKTLSDLFPADSAVRYTLQIPKADVKDTMPEYIQPAERFYPECAHREFP